VKLSIIVPVYNEGKTVKKILQLLLEVDLGIKDREIIVVNDCSTDNTAEVLKQFKKTREIKILTHQKNCGKTAGIKTGLAAATGDYVIIQDADLEYNPADIKKLIGLAVAHSGAAVYGSRFLGNTGDVWWHRLGNQLMTLMTNWLYGCHLTDMQTCYKLIPRAKLNEITITTTRFAFEPEVTSKLARLGVKIIEEPISYAKRGYAEGKKIGWTDLVATIVTLIKFRFAPVDS
jgi:glycosyltransferase involved in cell wall biosynthesis